MRFDKTPRGWEYGKVINPHARMPKEAGKRLLVKKVRFHSREFTIFLRPDADESVVAEIFEWQDYRAVEAVLGANALPILDVGAHIGVFTLYARALCPLARIHALEPEEDNFALLRRNVAANRLENVKLHQVALAGTTGRGRLLLEADSINHRLARGADETGAAGERSVAVSRLGDFLDNSRIPEVGLLKMDIEGGEYDVLGSLTEADFSKLRSIFLEYHDLPDRRHRELDELLRRSGFSVQVFPSQFEKGMGFMLARNKKMATHD